MATNKYKLQPVMLTPLQIKWIRRESKRISVSMSELVRSMISERMNGIIKGNR